MQLFRGFFVLLILSLFGVATAQIPPEVLEPYKAYNSAVQARDLENAEMHALKAWEAAEEHLGDHKSTGDLAYNYGNIASRNDTRSGNVSDAFERSIELTSFYGDEAASQQLEREVKFGSYLVRANKVNTFKKRFRTAMELAEENGLSNSTFAGELLTLRAQIEVPKSSHDKTEEYAVRALEVFENRTDDYETYYPYMARLYSGYGKEGNEDFIPALMEYQEVMQNLEGDLPRNHPFLMRALGRWMTMRNRIVREGLFDEAEAEGMCACWPYDKARNEAVRPVKRVPPKMPRGAWQSGFSIVEFDLNDDGSVSEPRLLESWPKDIWDKSSIRAVNQWQYTPRTADESDEDRKDIIVTIRYMLTDRAGNMIE